MFLDDKLFEICKNSDTATTSEIKKMYSDVMAECSNYLHSKIGDKGMHVREFDRLIQLYDLFIDKLVKNDMQEIADLFLHKHIRECFQKDKIYQAYKKGI